MDDQILQEFINESREHLATIESDLLTIEDGGADVDEQLVNKVFRAAHSIKGGSAFFGLNQVKELAHKAETVLDMLRARKMTPNAEITNVLLAAFDKLREMINHPDTQAQTDIADLAVSLTGLASSYLPPEQKASLTQHVTLHTPGDPASVTLDQVDLDRAQRSGQHVYCVDLDLIHDLERRGKTVLGVFRDVWESGEILDCVLDFEAVGTLDGPVGNQLPLRLVFATIIRPDDITMVIDVSREKFKVLLDPASALPPPTSVATSSPFASVPGPELAQPAAVAVRRPPGSAAKALPPPPSEVIATPIATANDSTLRVHVGLLETLMNLAGEMILSRNQLHDAIARNDSRSLGIADQRLNLVTSELQDAIMQTRLQPIGNVFNKFPRVVRDLANLLHKEVHLDLRGHDVAMDKSLIEGLSDPLTHMVRNAVDHGIATPEERLRAGKSRQGTIRLEARHEAGQVVVEIADDGQGIDSQRIAQSALSRGLITPEKLQSLTEQERLALIFLPGLSTAQQVTDISGRGVGMDVVKTNLDRLGGKIEIQSFVGQGTLFRIKLPLTLAIIPSLIVSVGAERFAIPQVSVEELLHIRAQDISDRLDRIGGAEVLLLRERILPLLRFADLLGVPTDPVLVGSGSLEVAVVTTGSMTYGLVVGAFHDTEEIVVKPLGRHLKGLREYAGATILGDGRVALILDAAGLAAKAALSAVADHQLGEESRATAARSSHSLLLFHNAPDELCAVPLEIVLRIERIKPGQVETKGGRRTMQYRGAALPLVTLADVAQVQSLGDAKDLAVIVSTVHGREVGLLGAMPVDVIETQTAIDLTTHRQRGLAGSIILNQRTALIADLPELVDSVYPDWRALLPEPPAARAARKGFVVLLAEDSDFFRAQVKRYLEEDGEVVFDAPDGESAWELLLEHLHEVQAVVTDIEMPRLSGLGLTQRIRADSRTAKLPVIGLSSLASEEDIARGKAAGIDDYQVKLDRDQLLACVRTYAVESAPAEPATP